MAQEPVNIFEYEEIAKQRLSKGDYDFIAGAATDEITLRRTRSVLDSIVMKPRMMVDISQRDLSTTFPAAILAAEECRAFVPSRFARH